MTALRSVLTDPNGLLVRSAKAGKLRTSADLAIAFNLTVTIAKLDATLVNHLYDDSGNLVLVVAQKGESEPLVVTITY